MVVGKGMIAKEFRSYTENDAVLIFGSGVSDSTNTDIREFEREMNLAKDTMALHPEKLFVYFSTCSIYDSSMQQSAYVQHKISMENFIQENHPHFIIFRLSNPIGYTNNTHTVVNYFIDHLVKQQPFEVWKNASRNIIDVDDVFLVCHEIIKEKLFINSIVNVANPQNYPVNYIIACIEAHFNIKGKQVQIDKGGGPVMQNNLDDLFAKLNIHFNEDYFPKLLKKYFPA